MKKNKIAARTPKPCKAGHERNPETGRCRKIQTCKNGYEKDPQTGKCRKLQKTNEEVGEPLLEVKPAGKKVFIATCAVVGLIVFGVLYIVFEFRREIFRKIQKLSKKKKNPG